MSSCGGLANKTKNTDGGCGTVGRVVTSYTRDPWRFSFQQSVTINCTMVSKIPVTAKQVNTN